MTVVEVTVAVFILGVTAALLMQLVATAEAIRGRAVRVGAATALVRNETERLRHMTLLSEPIHDTEYVQTHGGIPLRLERRVVRDDFGIYQAEDELITADIVVRVYVGEGDTAVTTFRFLQGYER